MRKEPGAMVEGEQLRIRELLKVRVEDCEGRHVGHLQDLALDPRDAPRIGYLAVHLLWTDRVGVIELARRAEDIVVLLPWGEVVREDTGAELITLSCAHPRLPVRSASGKWLVRRDILDKQMVDTYGMKIQRVDDVVLACSGGSLDIAGLEVSRGMLIASTGLRSYIDGLRRKHGSRHDSEVIPWAAVQRVEEGAVVIEGRHTR